VNASATGANTGTSWPNAFTSLQSALAVATGGDQIWVAAGTYKPSTSGDRNASFTLTNGVAMYGGFAGGETLLSARNWTSNVTILSGDLNGNDSGFTNNDENSYHVVIGASGATLDGFTISGGNANGRILTELGGGIYTRLASPSPTLSNLIISGNNAFMGGGIFNQFSSPVLTNVTISNNRTAFGGGGIYNYAYSSPTLTNVTISGNTATGSSGDGGGILNSGRSSPMLTNVTITGNTARVGGGIFNLNSSSPTLTNVIITGNTAVQIGGGIANAGDCNSMLTNVTISGNSATAGAGGIYNEGVSTPQIRNSIIWGNRQGGSVSSIVNNQSTPVVRYSIVEGGYSGTGNLNSDPLFVSAIDAASAPTSSGDYRLQVTSPAIDAGDNSVVSVTTDLAGNPRRSDLPSVANTGSGSVPIVDMGAYERQTNLSPTLDQPADLSILEDASVQTINLSGIGAGANESQTLSISAASSNPALIPNPTVSYTSPNTSASLSFMPVANANGTATITVTVQDSGGTVGGGMDTLTRSFNVTVTPVNDAPSFTVGANQSVKADAGQQTVSGWASGFSSGPSDEASQTLLGYSVVGNTNSELFSVAPAIDTSGTLTYTPKPGMHGTATISVVARDSGDTANGGADASTVHSFTITIGGSYSVYLPLLLR
jgi:hypothetical protein